MSGCGCGDDIEATNQAERRVLLALLVINGVMFVVELFAGIVADSTGLIADSLDMFADATVYGIAFYAVGRSLTAKRHAAVLSGGFQILLALGVAIDVLRRAIYGSEPVSDLMMIVGTNALVANLSCLALLSKHREGEVHMRASWIFSVNDVLANLGVIFGGVLVLIFGSRWPDLVIGAVIVLLVMRGGVRILQDAEREKTRANSCTNEADS
ncbi:MAG: cation transporter [Candidatus Thiodiazotropha endolucinida]